MKFEVGDVIQYKSTIIGTIFYVEKTISGKNINDKEIQLICINEGSLHRSDNFCLVTDILREKYEI